MTSGGPAMAQDQDQSGPHSPLCGASKDNEVTFAQPLSRGWCFLDAWHSGSLRSAAQRTVRTTF